MEKKLNRLQKIHTLIQQEKTGTPKEFANKLNLCESQLYNILDDLKTKGFPILYSRSLKSYVYKDDCVLEIVYAVNLLTSQEKIKIYGGILKKIFTLRSLEWTRLL